MRLLELVARYLDLPDLPSSSEGSVGTVAPTRSAMGPAEHPSRSIPDPGLPHKVKEWPRIWLEAYDERAAIMEFEGELPRGDAEARAEADIRGTFWDGTDR